MFMVIHSELKTVKENLLKNNFSADISTICVWQEGILNIHEVQILAKLENNSAWGLFLYLRMLRQCISYKYLIKRTTKYPIYLMS